MIFQLFIIVSLCLAAPLQKRALTGACTYYGPPSEAGPFGIGACGNDPLNHDYYVAVGVGAYDGSRCGQCIQVSYQGRTSIGPMADKCPGCGTGVDVSPTMMDELTGSRDASLQLGKIQIEWEYVPCPRGRGVVGGQESYASAPPTTVGSAPSSNVPASNPTTNSNTLPATNLGSTTQSPTELSTQNINHTERRLSDFDFFSDF